MLSAGAVLKLSSGANAEGDASSEGRVDVPVDAGDDEAFRPVRESHL